MSPKRVIEEECIKTYDFFEAINSLLILRKSISTSNTKKALKEDHLRDIFDLCQRILLDGSSERMIFVGMELIKKLSMISMHRQKL